jgi:hypothetical protein
MGIFIPYIRGLLATAGVSLVVLPTPRGCRASGATCFFTPDRATLVMSFRYLTDDHFWFTLFHEIGHLILHEAVRVRVEGKDGLSTKEEKKLINLPLMFLSQKNTGSSLVAMVSGTGKRSSG